MNDPWCVPFNSSVLAHAILWGLFTCYTVMCFKPSFQTTLIYLLTQTRLRYGKYLISDSRPAKNLVYILFCWWTKYKKNIAYPKLGQLGSKRPKSDGIAYYGKEYDFKYDIFYTWIGSFQSKIGHKSRDWLIYRHVIFSDNMIIVRGNIAYLLHSSSTSEGISRLYTTHKIHNTNHF